MTLTRVRLELNHKCERVQSLEKERGRLRTSIAKSTKASELLNREHETLTKRLETIECNLTRRTKDRDDVKFAVEVKSKDVVDIMKDLDLSSTKQVPQETTITEKDKSIYILNMKEGRLSSALQKKNSLAAKLCKECNEAIKRADVMKHQLRKRAAEESPTGDTFDGQTHSEVRLA